MHPKYSETVERLRIWASQEEKVLCVLLLGSQVRKDFPGDEWSDLDVLLLVDNPVFFRQTNTWLDFVGTILCETYEETFLDWIHLTWFVKRVLLTDNRAIDFSIMPYDRIDDVLSINSEIHANGYQVIYDVHPQQVEAKIEATLVNRKAEALHIPVEAEIWRTIETLLFHVIFAGKKLIRGEVWVAVSWINQQISRELLALIEYHAACVVGISLCIRYEGRFLEQRMAPLHVARLSQCFARYDPSDAIETLRYILAFSRKLAQEICEHEGYVFKVHLFDGVQKLQEGMFGYRE